MYEICMHICVCTHSYLSFTYTGDHKSCIKVSSLLNAEALRAMRLEKIHIGDVSQCECEEVMRWRFAV